ncbi:MULTISPECIES: hypothetical protein [unclassified Janthinobacterium]|uniref:hypothetical protein n=1 Tax=unclassified Janthinobacterium TaxID=2610881 RepID=UPI001620F85C|nr:MULTISPECIES: hypothetical protein [unclassified Janthinobacterium]MBB5610702.1 hypothetical protein [Janthinobacterium sp. S3T4]MBB5616188.1 hypothetical protein [Janthinobacterium sp. S3M3]
MENDQNEIESFKNETIIIVKAQDDNRNKRRHGQVAESAAGVSHSKERRDRKLIHK